MKKKCRIESIQSCFIIFPVVRGLYMNLGLLVISDNDVEILLSKYLKLWAFYRQHLESFVSAVIKRNTECEALHCRLTSRSWKTTTWWKTNYLQCKGVLKELRKKQTHVNAIKLKYHRFSYIKNMPAKKTTTKTTKNNAWEKQNTKAELITICSLKWQYHK